ncbi:S1/P1 nuclease [Paludibacterium purpuratum]|nr:S1/P1 nuclease [Paludibacterium purpuratum]
MSIKPFYRRAICVLGLLISTAAWGWGSTGHMAIGAIADELIAGTPAADHVKQILGPGEGLREAAIWADCAKSVDPTQNFAYIKSKYYDHQCQFFDNTQAGIQAMQDYVERNNSNCLYGGKDQNCHKSYHFTDIPIQQKRYDEHFAGADAHDIVHAMNAAVQVLQGHPAPEGFNFAEGRAGQTEALRLLAHLVGDEHQPLHVGAIYLDQNGQPLNPQPGDDLSQTSTQGGNLLTVGTGELHGEWDSVPSSLDPHALVSQSRKVPVTAGQVGTWPTVWASESVLVAGKAFDNLQFGAREGKSWPVEFDNRRSYIKTRQQIQNAQLVKGGARLAQLLQAIWPNY